MEKLLSLSFDLSVYAFYRSSYVMSVTKIPLKDGPVLV
jgi:hypothetical protein